MSVADMKMFENLAEECGHRVALKFGVGMVELFHETPEIFQGRSTQDEWFQQVAASEDALIDAIRFEILQVIEQIETRLHDGEFLQSAKPREL